MRRLPLSFKLLAAVLPLLVAVGALLTITVREGFGQVDEARLGARLGSTWEPLIETMRVIEAERDSSRSADQDTIVAARRSTNEQMVQMNAALAEIDDAEPLGSQLGETLTAIGLAREAVDNPAVSEARGRTASDAFDAASANLVTVGRLLASEAGETQLSRDLTAVAALAEVEQRSRSLADWIQLNVGTTPGPIAVDRALRTTDQATSSVALFRAVASSESLDSFRETGLQRALNDTRRELESLRETEAGATLDTSVLASFDAPVSQIADLRDSLALDVVAESNDRADSIALSTWLRALVIVAAALVAALLALLITRSITRRVSAVSRAAQEVSTTSLPALVEALHDPRGRAALPQVTPIDARGSDELAELAQSFNALQHTLGDVATEQVEVLRRGVSDIFVTMARRNRSLVDRQLSLLDELEAAVTDPEVLADYYRLDHLATRMRRNSESLLVLASAEPSRRKVATTKIDDVVRAAVGEVEDYRRVDILSLEPAKVRGTHVADIAHLLAELIDNATAFSSPDTRVRVEGIGSGDHYRITIRDEGIGMERAKLRSINELLETPPVVGLSVEPTLGMSVVSLLAAKHEVRVRLERPGEDEYGILADVVIPASALESAATEHTIKPMLPSARTDTATATSEPAATATPEPAVATAPSPTPEAAPAPSPVAATASNEPTIEELVAALDESFETATIEPPSSTDTRPAVRVRTPNEQNGRAPASPPITAGESEPLRLQIPADLLADLGSDTWPETEPTDTSSPAPADEPSTDPVADPPSTAPAPAPVLEPSTDPVAAAPAAPPDPFAPPTSGPAATLPPPGGTGPTLPTRHRPEAERPPAPPVFADGPIARPLVPSTAVPLPSRNRLPERAPTVDRSPSQTSNGLPVRTRPAETTAPSASDRTSTHDDVPVPTASSAASNSAPSALSAALSAFDAGRHGHRRSPQREPRAAKVTDGDAEPTNEHLDNHWEDPR